MRLVPGGWRTSRVGTKTLPHGRTAVSGRRRVVWRANGRVLARSCSVLRLCRICRVHGQGNRYAGPWRRAFSKDRADGDAARPLPSVAFSGTLFMLLPRVGAMWRALLGDAVDAVGGGGLSPSYGMCICQSRVCVLLLLLLFDTSVQDGHTCALW